MLAVFLLQAIASYAMADEQPVPYAKPRTSVTVPEQQKSEWIFAPIPGHNPTQGFFLAAAAINTFQMKDDTSPPSVIALAAVGTEKKSYGFAAGYSAKLFDDSLRGAVFLGLGKLREDFYGLGSFVSSGSQPLFDETTDLTFAGLLVTPRIFQHLYFGPAAIFASQKVHLDSAQLTDSSFIAPGIRLQYDSRNDTFYPTEGSLGGGFALLNFPDLGAPKKYQIYRFDFNQYFPIGEQSLAARVALAASGGDVPLYALPAFGVGSDLRGFHGDKYRNKIAWSTQAEYRYRLGFRWGFVGFAGIGDTIPDLSAFTLSDLFWSAGAGVRFRLAKENPIDIRSDFAYGDDEWSWYFGVGQAF